MKDNFIKGILNTSASIDLFPLRRTLGKYSYANFTGDIKAGLSVAMLSFSMSIAYAMIAGLPIYYGIFGCIIAALISWIFSSSHYILFGPSNASAVMLMSAFASLGLVNEDQRVAAAATIVVFVGIFLILASVLKITSFVRYVSRTVVTAYICAGALLIMSKQLSSALGIKIENANGFFEILIALYHKISETRWDAVFISVCALIILYLCKYFLKKLPAQAMALILASVICLCLKKPLGLEVDYVSSISVSDWKFTMPDFGIAPLRDLTFASVAVALFCIIEATSIGKSLAAKNADRLNTNQEIFSLGLANIAAGMFTGTVESGSLTRSAAGTEAGGKTVFVNLFCAAFMLLGLLVLGRFVGYIPLPALSAVIIAIAVPLFSKRALKLAIRSTRADAVVFFLTFFTGIIWSLDDSVYVGVCVSVMLFLKKASTPEVIEIAIGDNGEARKLEDTKNREVPEISIVHVGGNMFFGASDAFQDQVRRICEEPNLKVIVLKLGNAINFDGSSAGDIGEVASQMQRRGGVLYLSEASAEIIQILKRSGIIKIVKENNIFPKNEDNPTLPTANALKAAKKFLGNQESEVKIYV